MTTTVTTDETVVKRDSGELFLQKTEEILTLTLFCVSLVLLGYRAGLEEASRNESNRSD